MKKFFLILLSLMITGLISCNESSPSGVDYNEQNNKGKNKLIQYDAGDQQPILPAKKDDSNIFEDTYDKQVSKK